MKIKILIFFTVFAGFTPQTIAQQNKFDILFHKYLGRLEGKDIQIKDQSVEFRLAKTNLLYDYPKADIKYIILKNGDWISFANRNDINDFKPFGSFILSGGAISNVGKRTLQSQRKTGYELQSELCYNASKIYSVGFLLGYSLIETDRVKLLTNNNYSLSNSTANGGHVYHLRVGLNNHFKILPTFLLVPVINFYVGYSNQIISESTIIASSVVSKIPDKIEKGIEVGAGFGVLIRVWGNGGIIITCQYSRIFQDKNKIEFLYANIGYGFPID